MRFVVGFRFFRKGFFNTQLLSLGRPPVVFHKRELALLERVPWARRADGVEGPDQRLSSTFLNIRSALTGAWNARSVNCTGLLLGASV